MTSELIQLRNELAKSNNHETGYLRGCIADLIKDKADRNLLNMCLNAGVLQDFFQENRHDTFFINRRKNRLIEIFFVYETAAEKAISYCNFLARKDNEMTNEVNKLSVKISGSSKYDKLKLLWTVNIDDSSIFLEIQEKETSDGKIYFLLWFVNPEDKTQKFSIPILGNEESETFELWDCITNVTFKSEGKKIEKGTRRVICYAV